jgi:hypothetical protein
MKYIKLHSIKDNPFNYISQNLEKLIIYNVNLTKDFNNFLLDKNIKND